MRIIRSAASRVTAQAWLETFGAGQYAPAFIAEGFSSAHSVLEMPELTEADLRDGLGIKAMRPRKCILRLIRVFNERQPPSGSAAKVKVMRARAHALSSFCFHRC